MEREILRNDEQANSDLILTLSDLDENENENSLQNGKYIHMNIINANARSLNNKVQSLIDVFDEYDLSAAIITETWFKDGGELRREKGRRSRRCL